MGVFYSIILYNFDVFQEIAAGLDLLDDPLVHPLEHPLHQEEIIRH